MQSAGDYRIVAINNKQCEYSDITQQGLLKRETHRQELVEAPNKQQQASAVSPVGVVPVSTVKSQRLNSHRAVFKIQH